MTSKKLIFIERRIARLKQKIAGMGDMRPGTLTVQYRNPAERKTPFNQLSYTHRSKSRSEYVRDEYLETVRREIAVYKRFKSSIEELVDLSIQASRMRIAAASGKNTDKITGNNPQAGHGSVLTGIIRNDSQMRPGVVARPVRP